MNDALLVVGVLLAALAAGCAFLAFRRIRSLSAHEPGEEAALLAAQLARQFEALGQQLSAQRALVEALGQAQRQEFSNSRSEQERLLRAQREENANRLEAMERQLRQSLLELTRQQQEALQKIQESNAVKLEEMRRTVDERLQKTLDARLAESFERVSKSIESVQSGLGEMRTLAADVGGLKRALTNVKVRGTFGEVQLERILSQMLHAGQYESNVAIRPGSMERVEFALRLPGRTDGEAVWLPIDSKFPHEDYDRLLAGYESGDKLLTEAARKALGVRLRGFAREICTKYIDPPNTTDFAILFLPTEGLYAEVVQNTELFELLQRESRVTVTGPTTLSAFLNALQMGFKTLAIEKRSTEVWQVLGAVKTEFETFAQALSSAQKKIQAADQELEKLVGTRTNVLNRKLRQVERLPEGEVALLLGDAEDAS
ncbi:MAG: DNA recombination protein RmuC [Oscillospiraceae bacterium]|jgi:DNA recombination protein RmuC|nr:DNA recombination protein RmuC [Oscillospiraceae bacterium]